MPSIVKLISNQFQIRRRQQYTNISPFRCFLFQCSVRVVWRTVNAITRRPEQFTWIRGGPMRIPVNEEIGILMYNTLYRVGIYFVVI